MRLGLASLPILLTGCILITGEGESSSSTGAGGQGGGAGGRDQTTGAGGMANGVELLEVATDPPSHGAILAISTSHVGLFAIGDGAPFVFRANPGAPPPLALKFLVGYPIDRKSVV